MIIAIDASNIKDRGGLKHLLELINNVDISRHNVTKVLIYGGNQLDHLPEKEWLEKKKVNLLMKGGFFFESLWKIFYAEKEFINNANIVFAPGGTFYSRKIPYISMSQNMLVFEKEEAERYGFSFIRLRLFLLKVLQKRSFINAGGIIFISNYAKEYILSVVTNFNLRNRVIYFGSSSNFLHEIKKQYHISNYSKLKPYKILYVSILDVYKHQHILVQAIEKLIRNKNYPLELTLIGPKYDPFYKKYLKTIANIDDSSFVKYLGPIPYNKINENYREADLFVFASSCENMPNILIEAMTSGLPIACSNMGPMQEFLKDAGEYFNPLNVDSIAEAIEKLISNPALRYDHAKKANLITKDLSWKKCADETFDFIINTAKINY